MSVATVDDRHVYVCDLCGSKSSNYKAIDLHRKSLSGPDDPEVQRPEQDVILDVCYECRHELRQWHDGEAVTEASA